MRARQTIGLITMLAALAGCSPAAGEIAQEPEAPVTGSPPSDGITVHGDWRLELLAADGSVDEVVEFENGLTTLGAEQLADILTGATTPGAWSVLVNDALYDGVHDPAGPCGGAFQQYFACVDSEPSLEVTVTADGTIVLSGDVGIAYDSVIETVATSLGRCAASTAPDGCTSEGDLTSWFTEKTAGDDPTDAFEPIPVTAGQIVQVTVVLSFS